MKEWVFFPFRWKCVNAEHTFAVNKPFQSKCMRYFAYVLIYEGVWTVCVELDEIKLVQKKIVAHSLHTHFTLKRNRQRVAPQKVLMLFNLRLTFFSMWKCDREAEKREEQPGSPLRHHFKHE